CSHPSNVATPALPSTLSLHDALPILGGEWLEPTETYETIAPRDEEPLAAIGQATPEDVGRAVVAAREAFADGWSSLPGSERDDRSEEHTSELQSQSNLVCRLLLEKKK